MTETTRVSKAIIERYYGKAAARSCFAGCSTGGRMAAMEAQRIPGDLDGIITGAPSLDEPGPSAVWSAWIVQANTGPDGREILGRAKGPLIRDAVLKACGNADGVVDDPGACAFDPATLRCQGADGPACLTDAEIGVLEKWYAEPRNSRGEVLVPAVLPRGSETFWPGVVWQGADGAEASLPGFGRDFLRCMAFPEDPGDRATLEGFDFDRDPKRMAQAAELFNANDPANYVCVAR